MSSCYLRYPVLTWLLVLLYLIDWVRWAHNSSVIGLTELLTAMKTVKQNSDTRVEFPQTEARVEMARVCLHQHHSETKSFHKLAAAAGILPSG